MKKSTVNTLLILGAAAAAWFIFTSMRRRPRSTVEAGPTEKITEAEYEAAEVEPGQGPVIKTAQSVVDIVKSLKRSPEKKMQAKLKREAAQKRKFLKKQPKVKQAVQTFLTMPRAVRGFDDTQVLF